MNESVRRAPPRHQHRVLWGPESDPAAGEKKIEGSTQVWPGLSGHCGSRRDPAIHLEGNYSGSQGRLTGTVC